MTALLQKAFEHASRLSPEEQDVLATRLLAEIASEDEFDRVIAQSAGKLAKLSQAALEEYRAGRTEVLDPDKL